MLPLDIINLNCKLIYEFSMLFLLIPNAVLYKVSAIRAILFSYEIIKYPNCGFSLGYKMLLMRRSFSGSSLIISNIIVIANLKKTFFFGLKNH
jgi:hypothetical protein